MEAILACHPALSTEWLDWVAISCELPPWPKKKSRYNRLIYSSIMWYRAISSFDSTRPAVSARRKLALQIEVDVPWYHMIALLINLVNISAVTIFLARVVWRLWLYACAQAPFYKFQGSLFSGVFFKGTRLYWNLNNTKSEKKRRHVEWEIMFSVRRHKSSTKRHLSTCHQHFYMPKTCNMVVQKSAWKCFVTVLASHISMHVFFFFFFFTQVPDSMSHFVAVNCGVFWRWD